MIKILLLIPILLFADIDMMIKEQGKKVKIDTTTKSSTLKKFYKTKQGHTFKSDTSILIKFKNNDIDIPNIENKYNIKLKKKLKIGYYLFENNSKTDTVKLINQIIKNEKNIDSIKPNWSFGIKKM